MATTFYPGGSDDADGRELQLELSLKPFRVDSAEAEAAVINDILEQYAALLRPGSGFTALSWLLWVGDGSEICDFSGDLDAEFEWARYIGNANAKGPVPNDTLGVHPHSQTYLYTEVADGGKGTPPGVWTYRRLARLVQRLKVLGGAAVRGGPVRVGATWDPGPEFARSPFKYERHPEICAGSVALGKDRFVSCAATMHGDTHAYAGFPRGVPEGTSFGRFLGRQAETFLRAVGADYLWLSNGFGCGVETWTTTGPCFDGAAFKPEAAAGVRAKVLGFWADFRAECAAPVRLRGTNLTAGIDLASDGAPMREVYARCGGALSAPPNSPWAALDGNFGLELAGWMSHVAALPAGGDGAFLFRYYINDPWWLNSPWLDRYGREPHDIWLPLGVARIDAAGAVCTPSRVALLSVDDSRGRVPQRVAREVAPLLLDALAQAPDAYPPTVWVYPWDEYDAFAESGGSRLGEPLAGDWLVASAINEGLPLNAVVASGDAAALLTAAPARFADAGSVLVSRVPDAGTPLCAALRAHAAAGGALLLYGPLAHAGREMLRLLGLSLAPPLSGQLVLAEAAASAALDGDCEEEEEEAAADHGEGACGGGGRVGRVNMRPAYNAGGAEAVLAAVGASSVEDSGTSPRRLGPVRVLAEVSDAATGQRRVVSLVRRPSESSSSSSTGGGVAWVRGCLSASFAGGHLLTADDPALFRRGEVLLRHALAALGWEVGVVHRRQRHHWDIGGGRKATFGTTVPAAGGAAAAVLTTATAAAAASGKAATSETAAEAGAERQDAHVPWELVQLAAAETQDAPVLGVHVHDGGLVLSGFSRDSTAALRLRFPGGAPLLVGADAWLDGQGRAEYTLPRAWRRECRALVRQAAPGVVACVEGMADAPGVTRRIWLRGLRDAEVTLLVPRGARVTALANPLWPFVEGATPRRGADDARGRPVLLGVSGSLCVSW